MSRRPVGIVIGQSDLRRLLTVMRREVDGRELRNELARSLRAVLRPYADRAKNSALSIPSGGSAVRPALRPAIARSVQPRVNLNPRGASAGVRARKTPRIRGFDNAPKRTNSRRGWRTQSWGNDVWRVQVGKIGWFDNAMRGAGLEARRDLKRVMDEMARRIASRS